MNRVFLVGNLGKDPELKYTPQGTPVSEFSVATTEDWTDKSGMRQKRTEWHKVKAWGGLGEVISKNYKKGNSIILEGRIETRSWDDKSGSKRYTTEIIAQSVEFTGQRTEITQTSGPAKAPEIRIEDAPPYTDDLPF